MSVLPERTYELRRAALWPNRPVGEPLPGDDEPGVHLGLVDDAGALASTAFFFEQECPWLPGEPAWHLKHMATSADHRNQGLGGVLLDAVLDYVAAHGGAIFWCVARVPARSFYVRHGLETYGDPRPSRSRPELENQHMWRRVAAAAG